MTFLCVNYNYFYVLDVKPTRDNPTAFEKIFMYVFYSDLKAIERTAVYVLIF